MQNMHLLCAKQKNQQLVMLKVAMGAAKQRVNLTVLQFRTSRVKVSGHGGGKNILFT